MLLLALETSSPQGSCAIVRDDGRGPVPLAVRRWARARSHSEIATASVEAVAREAAAALGLASAALALRALDAIAVGVGPGSFTGIRVAVGVAKSLAYALAKPVYGFDSCEALAAAAPPSVEPLAVLVEAHKNLVYASTFGPSVGPGGERARLSPAQAIAVEGLEPLLAASTAWLCVGDGYVAREAEFGPNLRTRLLRRFDAGSDADANGSDKASFDRPDALAIAALAAQAAREGRAPLGWKTLQPLYVRASEAEEKLRENPR